MQQTFGRQEIIIALLLLWFSLTGGYAGRLPELLVINLVIWLLLMAWLVFNLSIEPVSWSLWGLASIVLLSALHNSAWSYGIQLAGQLAGYVAIYFLAQRWPDHTIHRAALLALPVYSLISFLPWGENSNILAFNVVGLTLLAMPLVPWLIYPALGVVAILGSVGGLLALVVAAAYSQPGLILFSFPVLLLGWVVEPSSFTWRLEFWRAAKEGFWASPWIGVGPGQFYTLMDGDWVHAHNIIISTLTETGLMGLFFLALLFLSVFNRWDWLPGWTAVLILAFAAWSMIDEPLRFLGPGVMVMMALSRVCTPTGEAYGRN